MKKLISGFAVLVIVLFCLSAFGWLVKHVTIGDKNFGPTVNKSVSSFVSFLDLFKKSVKEVQTLPPTFVKTPEGFRPINKLENDVNVLISYSNESNDRTVELRNLKDNSVAYQWDIKNPFQSHDRIMDPLLLPNKSLVYSFNGVTGLFAIDSLGNQLWKQNKVAHHHSMNLDSAGNIWACSYTKEGSLFIIYKGRFEVDGRELVYIDNTISQVDAKTGELLFHKSISEILIDNGLSNLIIKSNNAEDPIHLNDVQPALYTSDFFNEGDLFLSSRNLSCIIQYRPSTNKVIRLIEGLFYSQHDVDILNDSTIYFFNNNAHTVWQSRASNWKVGEERIDLGNFTSNVMCYDLKNDRFYTVASNVFKANSIFSYTEGMSEFLPDGSLFVEEQNSGLIWVIKNDEVIYKDVFHAHHQGYHHLPNWTRVITD